MRPGQDVVEGGRPVEAHASAWVHRWIADFVLVESQPAHVREWVDRTAKAITSEIPELLSRPEFVGELQEGVREHWVAFLSELPRGKAGFRLVPAAERIALQAAETSLPLETVGRVYRVAQRATWSYVTDLIAAVDGPESHRAELLIYLWDRVASWIDSSVDESVRIYQGARRRIEIGTNALRYETVSRILAGNVSDTPASPADLGGYLLGAHHTAFILSSEEDLAPEGLEELGRDLAKQAKVTRPLIVRPGGRRIWMWIATQQEPVRPFQLRFGGGKPTSAHVAIGPSRLGIRGFVESHHLAHRTADITTRHRAGVFDYTELELVVLLGCSPEVDALVRRALGGLTENDPHLLRLRKTLAAFMRNGANVAATSHDLMVHRNTIRYRLQRAQSLLGGGLTPMSPEVSLALRHMDVCHHDDDINGNIDEDHAGAAR